MAARRPRVRQPISVLTGGWFRVVHPFPSLLDAAVTGALALVAGAGWTVAGRLAFGMLALQFAIGAVNDVADREADRGRAIADGAGRPSGRAPLSLASQGAGGPIRDFIRGSKPVAEGLIAPRDVTGAAIVLIAAGLLASASVGFAALAVGALGLAVGLFYDLRLKGTPWSWLPFAAGVGLLPLYGWFGATGEIPVAFLFIVPLAVGAGAALAIANALVDYEVDISSGTRSIATAIGRGRALKAGGATLAAIDAVVLSTFIRYPPTAFAVVASLAGAVLAAAGLAVTARPLTLRRQAGWEAEAAGLALIGLAWIWTLAAAGVLA